MRSTLRFLLIALVLPLRGESQARQGGAWHLTTPGSGGANPAAITLELDALDVVRGPLVTFRPALYVRCLDEKLEAFVATGAVRDPSADYRAAVRLRWADRPPLDETWRRSTDYSAVFAPDPAAFIEQLLVTPDVVFELRRVDADPISARFNGQGLDAHLPSLTSKCRFFTGAAAPAPARAHTTDSVYAEVDEKAELLALPQPEYPAMLRRAGVQGTVVVEVVIDTRGRVEPGSPRVVLSPYPRFNEPALEAIQRATFRPARIQGRPVRVRVRVPIEFRD
ncbi:MAG: energy transducer TonB [Gemmatimonadales bacterium]